MAASRSITASSQPQRRVRPVVAPNSCALLAAATSPRSPVVLGRERPAADARRVGLGDAEHAVDPRGADAGSRADGAGDAVRGRDVGIGAVVDVEERALGALEQHVLALAQRAVEDAPGVVDVGLELLAAARRSSSKSASASTGGQP